MRYSMTFFILVLVVVVDCVLGFQTNYKHQNDWKYTNHRLQLTTNPKSNPQNLISSDNDLIKIHVAPMQAYTNQHLRHLYSLLNPSVWLWTEMEKTNDLLYSHDAFHRRLTYESLSITRNPCVLQLGGNDSNQLNQCIRQLDTFHQYYDEINLNCGCPSIETGGANYGAALMKDPNLIQYLIQSMKDHLPTSMKDIPISIKIRIAVHDDYHEEHEETYNDLFTFVNQLCQRGRQTYDYPMPIVVHARAAILSGLSTSKNRSIPKLHPEFVHQLAHDFPNHRITLNGGIQSLEQLDQVIHDTSSHSIPSISKCITTKSKIDGIMIGRWFLKRPLDLLDIYDYMEQYGTNLTHYLHERNHPPKRNTANDKSISHLSMSSIQRKVQAIIQYGEYAHKQLMDGIYSKSDILLPLCLIAFQLQDDIHTIDEYHFDNDEIHTNKSTMYTEEDLLLLQHALSEGISCALTSITNGNKYEKFETGEMLTMRAILKTCQQTIGKKVFNKIKRNRNEL